MADGVLGEHLGRVARAGGRPGRGRGRSRPAAERRRSWATCVSSRVSSSSRSTASATSTSGPPTPTDGVAPVGSCSSRESRRTCRHWSSAPLDAYDAGLARVAAAQAAAEHDGRSRIAGVHLEGPFLGGAPGAHPPELLGPVDLEWLIGAAGRVPGAGAAGDDRTRSRSRSPRHAGARRTRRRGLARALTVHVRTSAGRGGCRRHDGHAPLQRHGSTRRTARRVCPGAALDDDRLTPGLIADFVHVHPALLRLAASAKDCILVTDAVAVGVQYGGPGRRRTGRCRLPRRRHADRFHADHGPGRAQHDRSRSGWTGRWRWRRTTPARAIGLDGVRERGASGAGPISSRSTAPRTR